MPAIVCFDTQVFCWALRDWRNTTEPNVHKAAYLLEALTNDKDTRIAIPSIVLAEALVAMPLERQMAFTILVSKHFDVAPFDLAAAREFPRVFKAFPKSKGRQALKADALILATALARGARTMYTEDEGFQRRGAQFLEMRPLPTPPPRQLTLPTT